MPEKRKPYKVISAPKPPRPRRLKPWRPKGPFRFFDLPTELRLRVLHFALVVDRTVDLAVTNYKRIAPRLDTLLVSHRMHDEAYAVFYGHNTFRLFPIDGQFFHTRAVLLQRLPRSYREAITSMELRIGPGWSDPPRCWTISPRLGLVDCKSLRTLKIVIELDPSDDIFKGFRKDDTFYTVFCGNLMDKILERVPSLKTVIFDTAPSVSMQSQLLQEMLVKVKNMGKIIRWDISHDIAPVAPAIPPSVANLAQALAEVVI